MPFSHNTFTKAAATLASAVILVGCGSDDTREAASVSTSTSGTIVTDTSTDLGSIVIGWGEQHSDSEITTPKPEDVTARCTGRGDELAVDIAAPHGWKIHANHGSQTLTIGNVDQDLPPPQTSTPPTSSSRSSSPSTGPRPTRSTSPPLPTLPKLGTPHTVAASNSPFTSTAADQRTRHVPPSGSRRLVLAVRLAESALLRTSELGTSLVGHASTVNNHQWIVVATNIRPSDSALMCWSAPVRRVRNVSTPR